MDIKCTTAKMLSDRYDEKLQAEIEQCYIRMNELEEIIALLKATGSYRGVETAPVEVLEMQHKTMQAYLTSLLYRASLEKIEIRINA